MQVWGLYYEEQNRNFSGKVLYRSDIEVPRIITSKLTEKQLRLLKTTCLGDFFRCGAPSNVFSTYTTCPGKRNLPEEPK